MDERRLLAVNAAVASGVAVVPGAVLLLQLLLLLLQLFLVDGPFSLLLFLSSAAGVPKPVSSLLLLLLWQRLLLLSLLLSLGSYWPLHLCYPLSTPSFTWCSSYFCCFPVLSFTIIYAVHPVVPSTTVPHFCFCFF